MPQPPPTVLSYAAPRRLQRIEARHIVAFLFGMAAIALGIVFGVAAGSYFVRAINETTTRDRAVFRSDGLRLLLCSLLLLIPGCWYGLAALKDLNRRQHMLEADRPHDADC